jgi:hypothetical protein
MPNDYAMRLRALVFLSLVINVPFARAENIATCKDPAGYVYYHYSGLMEKEKSGFSEDRILGGLFTLVKLPDGEYDLLFVDGRQAVTSTIQDGGEVKLLRLGQSDATLIVLYPEEVIDMYTFYVDGDGNGRFDILQSRGGGALLHKSSVMTGECSTLDLALLR